MIRIAICSDDEMQIARIKDNVQDYLIENHCLAKVSVFRSAETMINVIQMFDIYFITSDMPEVNGAQIANIIRNQGDEGGRMIFIGKVAEHALKAYQDNAFAFLLSPVDRESIFSVMDKCRKDLKESYLIIHTSIGERRVRCYNLNYVNIVKRCLCYHLKDGNLFDGQTLRGSFEKAIHPLDEHPMFVFVPPSLLINLAEIKIMDKDHLTFEDDSVLYFPKTSYEKIHDRWLTYNLLE